MRKGYLLLSILLVFSIIAAKANPVGEQEAKTIGAKYLNSSINLKASVSEMVLAKTYFMSNGEPAFYVFNATKGYVIVSAQDVAIPILGYSDEGYFDANDIPETMDFWLKDYADQIQYGIETRNIDEEKTKKQWEMVKNTGRLSEKRGDRTVVGPLLRDKDTGEEILWNQTQIYSTQCPEVPNTENHYAAGCVPVSMSQIMRKWECPSPTGYGEHTSDGSHHEYVNFGETSYDWDNMPISLNEEVLGRTPTDTEITAVGTLLHHAGVAIDAFYKLTGTDAHSEKARDALVTYFGFSDEAKLELLTNKDDSIALWKVKLRSSLDHDYPMYYSGTHSGSLGHAFACDGYDDDDNFHINWGYDGNCNGYFPIGGLNYGSGTSGQYNANNDAIFNLHPAGTTTMFDINVSSNDDDMGTVSGSGSYAYGSSVTVTATAKPGYSFCYWSLNGVNMSESASYTFKTYYNRNMVAVFAEPYTITSVAGEHGSVSAGGSYNYGENCTLTATPDDGYVFVNWTKGGEIVSSHNPYSFKVVEDGAYVANFMVNEGVTISDGETYFTQYYPFGKSYKYYITEQIFTADEINCRGTIEGIKFFATGEITRNLDIYVKSTEQSQFIDKSDWISVKDSDLVFSGAVSFVNSNWTLIEFDKPFEYDGVNNLVILIDDNTGTSPSTTTFKAFDGTAKQSMMYRSDTNADPLSLNFEATYIGTYDNYTKKENRKNQIVLNIIPDATTTYSVTATVEPAGAGDIIGAGDYIFGELCTLTAEAYDQYEFKNWTKGGVQVSTDATYSFNVKEAQDLVANFYSTAPIEFMDDYVEAVCVANWDTDNDGFINLAEAAAVTDLGTAFKANTNIILFKELQYFTGLTSISNEAFQGCTKLTTIVIPENITSIGNSAFENCNNLTGSLTLPKSLTTIGTHAFDRCGSLTGSLVIPDNVTSLGMYAFSNCTGFDGTLIISNSLTQIGSYTFNGCSGLTGNIMIPNSVKYIYGSAFYGCSGFTGLLIIGESLSSISGYAFQNCNGITGIVTKCSTPPSAQTSSFSGMTLTIPLYVPTGTESTYSAATGWNSFSSVIAQLRTTNVPSPTAADVLCVDNTCSQNSDMTARYIYFSDDNFVMTVGSGATLTSINGIETHNASQLVIEDGAQLVVTQPNIMATVKKYVEAASSKDEGDHWYTLSSPVANAKIAGDDANTNLTTGIYDLYRYNETTYTWENYKFADNNSFNNLLENGRGYLYRNAADVNIEYSGEVNVDQVDIAVTNNGATLAGFNLIGNPYSHDIYKGTGTAIPNSKVSDYVLSTGFYYLTNYGSWQPGTDNSTAIKPGQGILVEATTAGTITIGNVTSNGSGSKSGNDYLQFVVSNDRYEDVAYAWFDSGYGLTKIDHRNNEVPMLYIAQNNQNYAIATMDDNTRLFALDFQAMTMERYTLKMKANGMFNYVHVFDRLTGEDVDMLAGDYSFVGTPNDRNDRFVVSLDNNAGPSTNTEAFAYQNGSDIIVQGEGELQIIDITGRMVMQTHINGVQMISTSSLQNGVYIFRLIDAEVKTQKIVVK